MTTLNLTPLVTFTESLMPETVAVYSVSRVSDGAGGKTESEQLVANTKGRMVAKTAATRQADGRILVTKYIELVAPMSVAFAPGQVVYVNGVRHKVTSVRGGTFRVSSRAVIEAQ